MQTSPNPHWQDDPDDYPEPHRLEVLPPSSVPNNWVKKLRQKVLRHWQPKPLEPPKVDPELPQLTAVERSAEVFRFTALSTEHWLSPQGYLREWLKFNARVFMLLLIPTLLVVPLITFTLGQFMTWAALIAATTASVVLFPLSALLVVGLISGLVYLSKALMVRQRDPRRDHYY